MPRAIDHVVLPVTTLTLARSRLTSLGFTVAPDARHPFGTGNCCVFFADGTYLEPITVLDRNAADNAAAEGLFFVKRLKRFTERHGEGMAMLAFRSDDAEADQAIFEAKRVSGGPVFRFARSAAMPDGSEQEIGVVLAYAAIESAPDTTLFACQRINTEALWNPAFTSHPNGSVGVTAATAVAAEPVEFGDYLSVATGVEDLITSTAGLAAGMEGQSISIMTPGAFRDRYGVDAPDPRRGLLLAAVELGVADLEIAVGYAGATAFRHDGRIVVPPSPGLGAVLSFGAQARG